MPNVDVETTDFRLNRNNFRMNINLSRADLAHGIMTYGRTPRWFYGNNPNQVAHALDQKMNILCAFIEERNNRFHLSPLYNYEDPSEKRVISYTLGMGFVNALSRVLYGVSHLFHLQDYETNNRVDRLGGMSPDYIGILQQGGPRMIQTGSRWLVLEAKGTCQDRPSRIDDAKGQVEAVQRINSSTRIDRVAAHLYFNNGAAVLFKDPPAKGKTELKIEQGRLAKAYYSQFMSQDILNRRRIKINNQLYILIVSYEDIEILIRQDVVEFDFERDFFQSYLYRSLVTESRGDISKKDGSISIYSDGIAVRLGEASG